MKDRREYDREYKRRKRAEAKERALEQSKEAADIEMVDLSDEERMTADGMIQVLVVQLKILEKDTSLDSVSRARAIGYVVNCMRQLLETKEIEDHIEELRGQIEEIRKGVVKS